MLKNYGTLNSLKFKNEKNERKKTHNKLWVLKLYLVLNLVFAHHIHDGIANPHITEAAIIEQILKGDSFSEITK